MLSRLVRWIKWNRKESLYWSIYLLIILSSVTSGEFNLSASLGLGAFFVLVRLILMGNRVDMS